MTLTLDNTLSCRKEPFTPIDAKNVRMYVCGPTVYDRPHLGNARSVVVYDVVYRLLCQLYGKEHVTYVRNITDVDDKINARAKERGITIGALTAEVTAQFHADMAALNCLTPTHEPRATAHIAEMIAMIEQLLARNHAYVADGHVLFDVASYKDYGQLSGRKLEDLISGARVAVEDYKRSPADFVLWKPADAEDDASSLFDSPWGTGRPGWHIECSAMSSKYLGNTFDIHGGGADLMFPHHENEIAQSCCAGDHVHFANTWVHNGFLTVNGEKMSKSLGNFITVHDLLEKGVKGEVIRLAFLMTKYNEPLNWSDKLLEDAKKTLDGWYRTLSRHPQNQNTGNITGIDQFIAALNDDFNTPLAISEMHVKATSANRIIDNPTAATQLQQMGNMFGLLQHNPEHWFKTEKAGAISAADIEAQITARAEAKKAKNFAEADHIRKELLDQGVVLEDKPGGVTEWRYA
jgi:cysteinyl-tRNA synthetase